MKRSRLHNCLLVAAFSTAWALPSAAERILYIDAAAPGDDPENIWADLSASGYDFVQAGSTPAAYNAANLSYDFEFTSGMDGVGDESIFDFDTAWETGDTEPEGENATPFTIVAFISQVLGGDAQWNIVSKTEMVPGEHFIGWTLKGGGGTGKNYSLNMQPGNNFDRHYLRTTAGSINTPMLLTMSHDGSGETSGTSFYVDGVKAGPGQFNFNENALYGSIRNNNPLVLGLNPEASSSTSGWHGSMFFIEIHDTVLTPEEVAGRWNGGDVFRPGQKTRVVNSALVPITSLQISFETVGGFEYRVQETDDTIAGSWTDTATFNGTGDLLSTEMLPEASSPGKAYRVVKAF